MPYFDIKYKISCKLLISRGIILCKKIILFKKVDLQIELKNRFFEKLIKFIICPPSNHITFFF